MSNKKEITVDVSAFGDSFVGFKFFVEQAEYTSRQIGPPIVRLQVLGVVDAAPSSNPSGFTPREQEIICALNGGHSPRGAILKDQIERADIKLASDALKSAGEAHGARKANAEIAVDEKTSASIYGRAVKAPVPEGVSIHHDLERRFTIAYRISANGKLAFVGIAYCSPQDQFCRRTGRELAISRLEQRPCRTVRMSHPLTVSDGTYPKNGAEWRAVEQSILLGLGLLR